MQYTVFVIKYLDIYNFKNWGWKIKRVFYSVLINKLYQYDCHINYTFDIKLYSV